MSEPLPTAKIEVEKGLFLSKTLADNWQEIRSTKVDFIKVKAVPSKDINRTESSFGYYPFLPVNISYPSDYRGKLMFPLAQINLSEAPRLAGYPDKGILQFFISMDELYGINVEQPDLQSGFCVRYFEHINGIELVDDMSFINEVFDSHSGPSPLYDSHKLSFSLATEYAGVYDLWYQKGIVENIKKWVEMYPGDHGELASEVNDIFSPAGHKIGGYPYFTQTDPRQFIEKFEDYVLLFQMHGDEKIMWGDAGVCNFFIHPHDLKGKDFSRVMYNWDCS